MKTLHSLVHKHGSDALNDFKSAMAFGDPEGMERAFSGWAFGLPYDATQALTTFAIEAKFPSTPPTVHAQAAADAWLARRPIDAQEVAASLSWCSLNMAPRVQAIANWLTSERVHGLDEHALFAIQSAMHEALPPELADALPHLLSLVPIDATLTHQGESLGLMEYAIQSHKVIRAFEVLDAMEQAWSLPLRKAMAGDHVDRALAKDSAFGFRVVDKPYFNVLSARGWMDAQTLQRMAASQSPSPKGAVPFLHALAQRSVVPPDLPQGVQNPTHGPWSMAVATLRHLGEANVDLMRPHVWLRHGAEWPHRTPLESALEGSRAYLECALTHQKRITPPTLWTQTLSDLKTFFNERVGTPAKRASDPRRVQDVGVVLDAFIASDRVNALMGQIAFKVPRP